MVSTSEAWLKDNFDRSEDPSSVSICECGCVKGYFYPYALLIEQNFPFLRTLTQTKKMVRT